ncbi:MAG TPA: RDD family protein [Pyrinomonadaceae bacterium]|jgi:uncharacterized RDD family membrane protein YckC
MMNDSVREELQTRVAAPSTKPEPRPAQGVSSPRPETIEVVAAPAKAQFPRPSPPLRNITTGISGAKTSPTLVEFQNRNAIVPDWRLQLQNSVRQRKDLPTGNQADAIGQTRLVTDGATALKAEVVTEADVAPAPSHSNPKVANALKRINESRKTFLPEEKKSKTAVKPAPAKNYPFNVVTKNAPPTPPQRTAVDARAVVVEAPKPKLVPTFKIEKKYDTNKLPRIAEEPATVKAPSEPLPPIEMPQTPIAEKVPEILIRITKTETAVPDVVGENDVIEDLAPVSMRFNAGLFDLIIGGFSSFALLSPLVIWGGNWFSWSGVAAFGAVWATVMFLYLTIAIGMHGKTLGMRMFGLELIDAEENDYPTFHQAAVHSAVYLLTVPLLGVGLIPMIFNEEQRAAHDLAAGTMIVTEF